LPGLMRDGQTFFRRLLKDAGLADISPEAGGEFEAMRTWLLAHCADDPLPELSGEAESIIRKVLAVKIHYEDVFAATTSFYERVRRQGEFTLPCPLFFQGELRPEEARIARLSRREEQKQQFIKALAAVIPFQSAATQMETEQEEKNKTPDVSESGASLSPMRQDGKKEKV